MTPTTMIALAAANPALTAILSGALEGAGNKVHRFGGLDTLTTFMRLIPLDVVVLDGESLGADPVAAIAALRADPRLASAQFDLVVLTRAAEPVQAAMLEAGADTVLAKPVTPEKLAEAVFARKARERALFAEDGTYCGPERRVDRQRRRPGRPGERRHAGPVAAGQIASNVVPLFARAQAGQPA